MCYTHAVDYMNGEVMHMQNWLSMPIRLGIRQSFGRNRLSLAQKAVVDWAKLDDYSAVLDVDCSDGRLLEHFLRRYSLRACGIAADSSQLREAVEVLGNTAEVLRADARDIPWRSRSFDLVCMTRQLAGEAPAKQTLSEILRVMKPAGQLVVAVPGVGFSAGFRRQDAGQERRFDNPYHLMSALNEAGFQDVSMRLSRFRHATVVAHAPEPHA